MASSSIKSLSLKLDYLYDTNLIVPNFKTQTTDEQLYDVAVAILDLQDVSLRNIQKVVVRTITA